MKLTFPKHRAALQAHTINTAYGIVAGYEVRDSGSRKVLGYVWECNGGYDWRQPNATEGSTRSTLAAAVEALRDIHDFNHGAGDFAKREPRLPYDGAPAPSDRDILDAWRTADSYRTASPRKRATPTPAEASAPAPAPAPARRVVWSTETEAPDLTAAMKAAFTKHQGGK